MGRPARTDRRSFAFDFSVSESELLGPSTITTNVWGFQCHSVVQLPYSRHGVLNGSGDDPPTLITGRYEYNSLLTHFELREERSQV